MLIQVQCPAKINFSLKVFPVDSTGYHPLETTFQAIGLFDSLEIQTKADSTIITTNWLDLPLNSTLHKVLQYSKEIHDLPFFRIHLNKRIPVQAGLGGGSSDAAGLLRALHILYPQSFPFNVQLDVARAIGKDVPFFLYGGRAKGTGYGDVIESLEDPPSSWICIVKPPFSISTSEAFKALDKYMDRKDESFRNDFDNIMAPVCQHIRENLLNEQALYAQLCGSGSAVYGLFLTKEQADQAALYFVAKGFSQTFVVSTITRQESLWTSYS